MTTRARRRRGRYRAYDPARRTGPEPYEVRFEPTRYRVMMIVVSAVTGLGGAAIAPFYFSGEPGDSFPDGPTFLVSGLIFAVFFGFFAATATMWTIALAGRRVALRVDSDGITLSRAPSLPMLTISLPWAALDGLLIYQAYVPYGGMMPFLGLRLHPDAPRPRSTAHLRSQWVRPGRRPAEIRLMIRGLRLDRYRLERAVRAYARHVELTDELPPMWG